MTLQHEIKSQLAKLLATEDLIVEHKQVQTAEFNVGTRVLTLPLWDKASGTVYDMLVGHEVGHALFTPDRNWYTEVQIPPQFVNIVEDVRIEKLMKRKYAGLAKCFYHGYEELNNDDFFDIADQDLDTFSLADRINLHYKIGNFVDLAFSEPEKEIVSLVDSCETFDDVLKAAKILYDYCVEQKKKEEESVAKSQEESNDGELDLPSNESGDDSDYEVSSEKGSGDMTDKELLEELNKEPVEKNVNVGGKVSGDLDLKTVDALEDALKGLTSTNGSSDNSYFELPKVRLDRIVVPNQEIHNVCKQYWDQETVEYEQRAKEYGFELGNRFEDVDRIYAKFKRTAQKEVNYLVKEFECRKAASSYARATTSRTGVLDTAKLHTYRYNEDLFKKVTTLAEGKNHGLVFVLDWSGSMAHVLQDTLKQLYNLLWFCKKVNIPFEVYAFTNNYPLQSYLSDGEPTSVRMPCYEKEEGVAHIDDHFSMMNILTSKVRGKVLEEQMINIFRIGLAFSRIRDVQRYGIPIGLELSGTPLNESLIALHQILPKFKRDNKLEKVQCVILTDGQGSPLRFHKNFQRNWEDSPFLGTCNIDQTCFLRDRTLGTTYSMQGGWWSQTDHFLRNLRDKFSDMNFIGIRILAPRDGGEFIRKYTSSYSEEGEKLVKSWRKDKAVSIKNSGYHTYFGLSAAALANEDGFDVREDATKAQIRSAFKKSLNGKKMNKKILGEFIELVA